jgi:hypothetical protein
MSPDMAVAVAAGVGVPLLLAAVPGTWHLHKWLSRVESTLAVVESRSVQLTPNSGSHVADVPEAVKLLGVKLDAVRSDALSAADGVAAKLAVAEAQAERVRARMSAQQAAVREALDVLMSALEEYARDDHRREVAYVKALKHYNIDLTDIAKHLDSDDVTEDT